MKHYFHCDYDRAIGIAAMTAMAGIGAPSFSYGRSCPDGRPCEFPPRPRQQKRKLTGDDLPEGARIKIAAEKIAKAYNRQVRRLQRKQADRERNQQHPAAVFVKPEEER